MTHTKTGQKRVIIYSFLTCFYVKNNLKLEFRFYFLLPLRGLRDLFELT